MTKKTTIVTLEEKAIAASMIAHILREFEYEPDTVYMTVIPPAWTNRPPYPSPIAEDKHDAIRDIVRTALGEIGVDGLGGCRLCGG